MFRGVVGGGWWWWGGGLEALPPILRLLKSSHERPCQELQCGLHRPSQSQSRLRDATARSHSAGTTAASVVGDAHRGAPTPSVARQMQEEGSRKETGK